MEKLFYPAIFHEAEEGGFWVSFPDLPECLTEGDDMQQAYEMAVDALGLSLTSRKAEGEPIPKPTEINKVDAEDGILAVVEFDMMEYQMPTQHGTAGRQTETGTIIRSRSVRVWGIWKSLRKMKRMR